MSSSNPQDVQYMVMSLLPRRREVYEIIKDHPYIAFNSILRRFPSTARRTLAYDVSELVKARLIIKHGATRGVLYSIPEQ